MFRQGVCYEKGMRIPPLIKIGGPTLVAGSGIYIGGVAQTGMSQVDANLCELLRAALGDLHLGAYSPRACHVHPIFVWGWVAIAALAALYLVFLFVSWVWKLWRRKPPAGAPTESTVQTHTSSSLPALRLSTGTDGLYVTIKSHSVHTLKRILNLKVENTNRENSVTDIEVSIRSIGPYSDHIGPWRLKSGFPLAAGAETFIPLASHGELHNESSAPRIDPKARFRESDSLFEVLVDRDTPYAHNVPTPPKDTPQIICIRATGMGTSVCDYRCRIWVDRADGRLRAADADGVSAAVEYLSLYEAAQRLVDARLGAYDRASRRDARTPIQWWSYWIGLQTQLYGKLVPARVMSLIPSDLSVDLTAAEDSKSVVAEQRSGPARWEEVSISATNFSALLALAQKKAGEIEPG